MKIGTEVKRATGSKGVDISFMRNFQFWKTSCKKRAEPLCKKIDSELETHDLFIHGCDRGIPIVSMHLPKFIEFCGGEKIE
jgi:hypothetical protein